MSQLVEFTPTARLADYLLGGLEEFVRSRRAQGLSWRRIARDIYECTNREIDVTHEVLRRWFPDENEAA